MSPRTISWEDLDSLRSYAQTIQNAAVEIEHTLKTHREILEGMNFGTHILRESKVIQNETRLIFSKLRGD